MDILLTAEINYEFFLLQNSKHNANSPMSVRKTCRQVIPLSPNKCIFIHEYTCSCQMMIFVSNEHNNSTFTSSDQ